MLRLVQIDGVTDESGDAVVDSPGAPIIGEVIAVQAIGNDLTAAATLDLNPVWTELTTGTPTVELGETFVDGVDIGTNDATTIYPRRPAQDNEAAALDLDGNGLGAPVRYAIAGARIRATVAGGGDTKRFRVLVLVDC